MDAQDGLRLCCSQTHKDRFSRDEAQLSYRTLASIIKISTCQNLYCLLLEIYRHYSFLFSDILFTFFQSGVVFISWLIDTKCKPCCQKSKIKSKVITEEEMVDLLGDSIGRDGENTGS